MFKKRAFTLIELLVSMTLLTIILIVAFSTMWSIWITRLKVTNRLDVNQELFFSIEKIVSTIKEFDWDIDYDEYWNRKSVWTTISNSWHYIEFTWFGNYGDWWSINTTTYWSWFYYCRSWNLVSMWTGWCLDSVYNSFGNSQSWSYQRFGQYAFQFMDYNANENSDSWWLLWDEDWNWNIRWDDDDEDLWIWPEAFSGNEVKELYLLKKWRIYERFLMRLNIKQDPKAPNGYICTTPTWTWCVGNIQILKLVGKDLWLSHSWTLSSSGKFDWRIDTWQCHDDYVCKWPESMPNSIDDWWIDLLPDYINVKDFKIFLYPNKDYKLAWQEWNNDIIINPIIKLNMTLGYSWQKRRQLNWVDPIINISTSINLSKN